MKPVASPYPVMARTSAIAAEVRVLDARTRYWVYGPQQAVRSLVLVHGFRGDHHGLDAIAAHLLAAPPDLRVIVPDLPGFGMSEPLPGRTHDIRAYADWLVAFRDELGLRDAPVLGHSFGTIVVSAALAGGMRAPRVVLVNPIAAPALSGPNAIGTGLAVAYYRLGALLPERLGFALLRWRVVTRGMSVTMAKTRDPQLRRWIHDQHDRYFGAFASRSVVLDAFRASVGNDVSEYAREIPIPVLLIAGDRDDITPVAAQHDLVAAFPDATLRILPGVGHLTHYERPREVADLVTSFLSEEP